MENGTLYIVSTPIGNLEDITLRAIRILKEVDLVASEDTRHSAVLLKHHGIDARQISYYDQVEAKRSDEILGMLREGKNVALITDAGTPLLSDPGYRLVAKAIGAQITVVPVPGASALLSAMVASGLASDRFCFEGFLPKKKGRQTRLKQLATEPRTIVIYESPYRVLKTLRDLQSFLGDREVTVARELTKLYEEFRRGPISEMIGYYSVNKPKGEFVLVLEGLRQK